MQSVLISIRPQWCELIASGKKTIEVRKSRPKLETPFNAYIYQTKPKDRLITILKDGDENYGETYHGKPVFIKTYGDGYWTGRNQKVIGEFVCDAYIGWSINPLDGLYMIFPHELAAACLTGKDFEKYGNGKTLYGWHISALQIYDKPKGLSEFFRCCTEKDDCHKCIHWDSSYDNTYYEPPDPPFEGCRTGEKKYFTRPPQSWCYVEELI